MAFLESFDRADENLEASANWTRVDGAAGAGAVRSNQFAQLSATNTLYQCPDQASANHYAQAASQVSGAWTGFMAIRATDSNNFIGIRPGTNVVELYKRVAGTFTLLGSATVTTAVGVVYYVEGSGNNLTVKADGVTKLGPTAETAQNTVTRSGLVVRTTLNPTLDSFESGALSSAAALAGNAQAQAAAGGALTTAIQMIGAAVVVATASGALSTSIPLTGSAIVTATATGDLSTQIRLDGTAIAQALASAGLTTGIPLAGAAVAQATGSGDLSTGNIAGNAQAIAAAVGSLTTYIVLSGAAIAQALASGDLTAPGSGLAGAAQALATATGQITTQIPLVGSAQAYASAAGGLTTIIQIAGAAAAVSAATGDLTASITLSGEALAAALASGSLTAQIVLSGSAIAQAAASGTLAGSASIIIDHTWLVRPRARNYSARPARRWRVTPPQRQYIGSR